MEKALIAMSGGVDSSVAAYLMKEKGYECSGAMMRLFGEEGSKCAKKKDEEDAKAVAAKLEMPFEIFDFRPDFKAAVIDNFIKAYESGATPNPCIDCNRNLKFARFFEEGVKKGFDYIVTGHYVQVEFDEKKGRYLLKKAKDETKDQSYVLYSLTQQQLAHVQFPLGSMTKDKARELAGKIGLDNAQKSDSQDICFVPEGHYSDFIRRTTGKDYPPGNFVDEEGKVLGTHKGIINYTIGQRRGLGIAAEKSYYVVAVNPEDNTVILSFDSNRSSDTLYAENLNFISIEGIGDEPVRAKAKIRYRSAEQWATVYSDGPDRIKVVFDEPQRAITKGQAVVLYDKDSVIGGGTIVG